MMVMIAVKRAELSRISQRIEAKQVAEHQAICHRWGAPMAIPVNEPVVACQEFSQIPEGAERKLTGIEKVELTTQQE
jgi:hypothetical protein